MQIEQLQYIVEIERAGSISAAAENLHVSQSAVSKSLSRIEHNLGLSLFSRSRTGVTPTETGVQLIHKAKEILNKLQEFKELAEESGTANKQKINIACVPMFSQLLSESLELLMNEDPNTRVDIMEKNSRDIINDVRQNTIDVGFTVVNDSMISDPKLKYSILLETVVYVCINKQSPLIHKGYLRPEDLLDQKIVIYNGSMIDWFSSYFKENQSIQYSIVTTNLESIKRKISQGAVISILSGLTIKNHGFLTSGNLVALPLFIHDQIFKMQIASVRLKQPLPSKISKNLHAILEQKIASSINDYGTID